MSRLPTYIAAVLLAGCSSMYPHLEHPTASDRSIVDLTVEAWEAHGRDEVTPNRCPLLGGLMVLRAPQPEVQKWCQTSRPVYGCAYGFHQLHPFDLPGRAVVVISTTSVEGELLTEEHQARLISHEVGHVIRGCVMGDVDWHHTDTELWDEIVREAPQQWRDLHE